MATVFLAGSIDIKQLHPLVKQRIDNVVASKLDIVLGDANGADSAIQRHLADVREAPVTVYCSGSTPRNNIGGWPVYEVQCEHARGSRSFFTAKDLAMAQVADFGLMIWDAKSTGTLSNVIELLARAKKSVVFVSPTAVFETVSAVEDLERLVGLMSEPAKRAANRKIDLFERIAALRNSSPSPSPNQNQLPMFG